MELKDGVCKYLDISTGHITANDDALLTIGANLLISDHSESGHWVLVPFEDGFEEVIADVLAAGFSGAFTRVLRWASWLDCQWVHLHGDGNTYEELPTFDW